MTHPTEFLSSLYFQSHQQVKKIVKSKKMLTKCIYCTFFSSFLRKHTSSQQQSAFVLLYYKYRGQSGVGFMNLCNDSSLKV